MTAWIFDPRSPADEPCWIAVVEEDRDCYLITVFPDVPPVVYGLDASPAEIPYVEVLCHHHAYRTQLFGRLAIYGDPERFLPWLHLLLFTIPLFMLIRRVALISGVVVGPVIDPNDADQVKAFMRWMFGEHVKVCAKGGIGCRTCTRARDLGLAR